MYLYHGNMFFIFEINKVICIFQTKEQKKKKKKKTVKNQLLFENLSSRSIFFPSGQKFYNIVISKCTKGKHSAIMW